MKHSPPVLNNAISNHTGIVISASHLLFQPLILGARHPQNPHPPPRAPVCCTPRAGAGAARAQSWGRRQPGPQALPREAEMVWCGDSITGTVSTSFPETDAERRSVRASSSGSGRRLARGPLSQWPCLSERDRGDRREPRTHPLTAFLLGQTLAVPLSGFLDESFL